MTCVDVMRMMACGGPRYGICRHALVSVSGVCRGWEEEIAAGNDEPANTKISNI